MPRGKSTGETDGRRLRSQRSREAIMNAIDELTREGILVPTAQQVSDRAGIGIRTVFRLFDDMETLYYEMDQRNRLHYEPLFLGGDRSGTLEERIKRAINRRSDGFEKTLRGYESTKAQLWKYESLRKTYARNQRGLRQDLENWLPEVKSLPRDKREAVDAVTSGEMWQRLRDHQGLGVKISKDIIIGMVSNVLLPQ